jgi:lipopolysaccharide export system permease protein
MRILHRYILREIALHFFAVTTVLAVILVSFRIAKVLDLASNNQLPSNVVLALIGYTSLTQLTVLMPIGLFLGVMLALGRLYHDSEMAAVQSCGIGMRQMLRPVFAIAVVVFAFLVWLALMASPEIYGRGYQIRMEALRQARLANISPQHFSTFAGGDVVYYAESVDDAGILYNVFVQRRVGDKVEVTVADRAEQLGAGEAQQTFVLYKGQSYEGVPGSGVFRITHFEELGYPIKLPVAAEWSQRVESKASSDLIFSSDPVERAELQKRIASPLMALILALLAVPLARLQPRQGRYAKMGWGLLAYFLYQVGIASSTVWIEKQAMFGIFGTWWAHAVAVGFGVWLILRQDPLQKVERRLAGAA